ncbi:MAG: ArnT family glycosyltransferase [Halioglobus sp.]
MNLHITKLWFGVILIVICGAILRGSYNTKTQFIEPIRGDAAYYIIYAQNLLEHSTFSKDRNKPPVPDSYWAPGYPVFLASVIKLSEILNVGDYGAILWGQVILAAATILLTFLLARTFLPAYWPLLPASLVALSPHLVSIGAYALTETLFGFLLLLCLYFLSRSRMSPRWSCWLFAGISLSLAYLVNPVALVLAPVLASVVFFYRGTQQERRERNARAVLLLVLPIIVVATLWSVRTSISVPDDQPSSSGRLLTNLKIGLYDDYHDKWRESILQPEKNTVVPGAGIDASYSTFYRELYTRILEDPVGMLSWYAIEKPILLWSWNIKTGQGDVYIYPVEYSLYHISTVALITYSLMSTTHFWLFAASVLGLVYLVINRRDELLVPVTLYATLIAISAVYVISQAEPRYSIPLRSEMYICATFFFWQTSIWLGRIRRDSR